MARYNRQEISDCTGFDKGDEWTSEEELRSYMTVEALRAMGLGAHPESEDDGLGNPTRLLTQDELDDMADQIVAERWHLAASA